MTLLYLKRISAGKVFICLITNPIKFSMTFKLMIYIVVMINHSRIRMCLYEFIKDEKRRSYITHWHLDNKERTTITWTCEFNWLSKWFWRLLMEQRKRQKKLSLQWYFSEWFTFIAVKCYYMYIIFHGYSLPCYPVSNLCPNRCPRGIQPVSQWHSSYRLCCWKNWASIFNYVFEVVEGALVFKVIFVKNLAI